MMNVDLKDRRRDITFVKKELCLDCNSDDYDQVTSKIIKGEYGSAVVRYVSYRFAVVGEVDLHFGNEDVLDVYGTVNAHCVSNYKYGCPVSDCDKVYHSITLFSKNQNQPSQVESFGAVKLSRPVLVVPAYASLLIEVDLWVYDAAGTLWGNYKDVARIDAKQLRHCTSAFDIEVSDDDIEKMSEGCGLVEVLWGHADSLLAKSEYKNEEEDKGEREECKTEERAKRAKLCLPQQSMSTSSDCRSPRSTKPMDYLILEVFSVFIGCFYHYDEPSRVYGVIEVHDKYGSSIIFERDEEHYEIYPCKGNAFQLNSVRSFTGASLSISANLKDNTQDYQISKGDLVWDKDNIQNEISWCDRPLCSVIRGDRGYAAIHYTILSSAVQAKVNMSLFANGSSRALSCLHGSVFAWYNTYQHSTDYEMAFYKLKLFQIDSENSLSVTSGVKIPLSRSLVSVTPNSSLIIGVILAIVHRPSLVPCTVKISNPVTNDVEVLQKDPEFETDNSGVPPSLVPCAAKTSNSLTKDVETLQKDVGFEADNSGVSSQMIWGEYYRFEVSVEWSEVQESLA